MEASQSAKVFADVKQSLATVEVGKEQGTLTMFKRVLTIKAARVEGGFASSDKATLSVTGMRDSKKVIFRVNMHLENSQWKVGTGAIREVE